MVIKPGDELPDECTRLGKFAFRPVDASTGLVYGLDGDYSQKRKLPLASRKDDIVDLFETEDVKFCNPDDIAQGKIFKAVLAKEEEVEERIPRNYNVYTKGFVSDFKVVNIKVKCGPLGIWFKSPKWCKVRYFSATHWRFVLTRTLDGVVEVFTLNSGSIDETLGTFNGLPDTFDYTYPYTNFGGGQPYKQAHYRYIIQVGTEALDDWLATSDPAFAFIHTLANCVNPGGDGDPGSCSSLPPA